MKLLLDTHVLLWSIGETSKLSGRAAEALRNTGNEVWVSAVSLWEIALKHELGKLSLQALDIEEIPLHCADMGFGLMPLSPHDALAVAGLRSKKIHKDPFDRMLIAQSIRNRCVLVSCDSRLPLYGADGLVWLW